MLAFDVVIEELWIFCYLCGTKWPQNQQNNCPDPITPFQTILADIDNPIFWYNYFGAFSKLNLQKFCKADRIYPFIAQHYCKVHWYAISLLHSVHGLGPDTLLLTEQKPKQIIEWSHIINECSKLISEGYCHDVTEQQQEKHERHRVPQQPRSCHFEWHL